MAGHNTLEELRKELTEEATQTTNRVDRGNLELQIVSKLAKDNQIEVPEGAVQQEKNRILADLQAKKVQINQQIIQNIEASARYNLARTIIMEAIYNKESSLEITPDELDKALEKASQANGKAKDEFVSLLYNAKQMDSFMNMLKADKVLDFIIGQAKSESEIQ
jgi:FKBP-type peptidyl-prolyl cis-trans isomerase (trigger factor)